MHPNYIINISFPNTVVNKSKGENKVSGNGSLTV